MLTFYCGHVFLIPTSSDSSPNAALLESSIVRSIASTQMKVDLASLRTIPLTLQACGWMHYGAVHFTTFESILVLR